MKKSNTIARVLNSICNSFRKPTEEELAPFEAALKECNSRYSIGNSVYFLSALCNEHNVPKPIEEMKIRYPFGISGAEGLLWDRHTFARKEF